jgi:hypothetical protein
MKPENLSKLSGGNWLGQTRRLAIYLRDGLSCAYCGEAAEQGAQLSLDHVNPRSKGGHDGDRNLVTACKRCNDSRGNRSLKAFCYAAAAYLDHGVTGEAIYKHVLTTTKRNTDEFRVEARKLIALRGTAARALLAFRLPSHDMHDEPTKAHGPVVVLGADGRKGARVSDKTKIMRGNARNTKRGGQRSAKTKAARRK